MSQTLNKIIDPFKSFGYTLGFQGREILSWERDHERTER